MNITISHDGTAIVLRIEPGIGDGPIQIGGLLPQSAVAAPPGTAAAEPSQNRSWRQSRPVRIVALAAVLIAFLQVGMVLSGPSRTAVEPQIRPTAMKTAMTPTPQPPRANAAQKTAGSVPPEVAIADALAGQSQLIGSTVAPSAKPGSAKAQTRFGLDP